VAEEPFSRVTLGVAAGLAVVLAVGVVVVGLALGSGSDAGSSPEPTSTDAAAPRTGPLALVAVDAPGATSPECASLTEALPDELTSNGKPLTRLDLAEPAPQAAAAWSGERGEPVVLRCGLGQPAELTPTAQLRQIDKVTWLPVEGDGAATWYTVDRAVFVALTVPEGTGTGALQTISELVTEVLPVSG
jgi:hypothetical protein